jgi:hypothetical protein
MTASLPSLSVAQADHWITPARLVPYRDVASTDGHAAVDLYLWNVRLSSACLEVIHHVEVLVRNAIHRQLSRDEVDDNVRSWLVDPAVLRPGELNAVEHTIARMRLLRRPVTRAGVVAALPLSFWTRLLGRSYEDLWKSSLHHAFAHGAGLRKDVAGQLNRMSQLRNDIAHHQPIIGTPVADRHQDMLAIAAAVDPAAADWIAGISRVSDLLSQVPRGMRCCAA